MRILFRGFAASVLLAVSLIAGTAGGRRGIRGAGTKDAVDDIAKHSSGRPAVLTSYGASSIWQSRSNMAPAGISSRPTQSG
jgi:hypothetical protein